MKTVIVNSHFSKVLGGSEIQCHQIAGTLVQMGIEATYLAVGGIGETEDPLDYPVAEVPKKAEKLADAILKVNPDIVYWRFNKRLLPQVMAKIKSSGLPVVFSVSHILDLQPYHYKTIPGLNPLQRIKRRLSHLYKGWQYAQALKSISGVICNNEDHLARISHDKKIYIPNSPYLKATKFEWPRPYIVWVGNLKAHKHPELFIDLARSLNDLELDFLMIGDIQQEAYDYVRKGEGLPDNFHYLGVQDIHKTNGVISQSLLLVHTCEPEGFPNVFLQAWGFGKPVISLYFDPGSKILDNEAGLLSGTFEQLKADTRQLVSSEAERSRLGKNAEALIERDFIKARNVEKLNQFLTQILDTQRP